MGEIIGSKVFGDKVIYHIIVDEQEALALEGRIRNIHMFTLEEGYADSSIISKAKANTAKYFVLPQKYRLKTKKKLELISAQKLETNTKAIFIYVCEK